MNSLTRWIGPGAIVGGVGAALLCGAGAAGADTGADAGPTTRASQVASAAAEGSARPARAVAAKSDRSPAARAARDGAAGAPRTRAVPAASVQRTAPTAGSKTTITPAAPAPAAAVAAASTAVVPSTVPVDPERYAGTYYEQGSVKQFFSFGLVNTKAVYTVKTDGSLRVQNSGNYFFNRGPKSSIVGAAVPVNTINTALNVGFVGKPSSNPPGNYLIIDRAPDYSWAIVSDPSGRSGFILTRDKTIDPQTYQQLVSRAQELGVRGRITVTKQFPA